MTAPAPSAIKDKMKDIWTAGDFGQIARFIETTAAQFIDRCTIRPGMDVLDAACGTGNLALPAARRGAAVHGVDIAPNLLEQGRQRARAENLPIDFREGDVEALPYPDRSFDLVVTMFGAMFAPDPERTAAELIRVCRPGGELRMANWTPDGFTGKMFAVNAEFTPKSPLRPPIEWGVDEIVRSRLKNGVQSLRTNVIKLHLEFPFGPADTVEHFIRYFGPTERTYASLDASKQIEYRRALEDVYRSHNIASDGTTRVPTEYLEVIALIA